MHLLRLCSCVGLAAVVFVAAPVHAGDDPFADVLISFDPGVNPQPGYDQPLTVLGSPERFTGEDFFPSVVSPFSAPYGFDEIVSIGSGGHLAIKFNTPVTNDPNNLYGIDLLVFGNTGFVDANYPDGIVDGLYGNDGGVIEVSADGVDWRVINGVAADGLLPSIGYLDSGPFDDVPGTILSDFTQPPDPRLTFSDFFPLHHRQVVAKY